MVLSESESDRFKQTHWQDSVLIQFLEIGSFLERQISDVTHAFVQRNAELAADVIKRHKGHNFEKFFNAFPLDDGPSAEDVRFFATALRIGRKLERIDKAGIYIAKVALQPAAKAHLKPVSDLELMSRWVQENLETSLQSFAERDAALAGHIVHESAFVDDVADQILRRLFTYMAADPIVLRQTSKPMAIAQALQHAADHVVDVAELTLLCCVLRLVAGLLPRAPRRRRRLSARSRRLFA